MRAIACSLLCLGIAWATDSRAQQDGMVDPLFLLGVFVGQEVIGWRELAGLVVILGGVVMLNLAKYRATRA